MYTQEGPDGALLLGAWVSAARHAYKLGLLPKCREDAFRSVPGWEWGSKINGRKFDHEVAYREYLEGIGIPELAQRHNVTKASIRRLIAREKSK